MMRPPARKPDRAEPETSNVEHSKATGQARVGPRPSRGVSGNKNSASRRTAVSSRVQRVARERPTGSTSRGTSSTLGTQRTLRTRPGTETSSKEAPTRKRTSTQNVSSTTIRHGKTVALTSAERSLKASGPPPRRPDSDKENRRFPTDAPLRNPVEKTRAPRINPCTNPINALDKAYKLRFLRCKMMTDPQIYQRQAALQATWQQVEALKDAIFLKQKQLLELEFNRLLITFAQTLCGQDPMWLQFTLEDISSSVAANRNLVRVVQSNGDPYTQESDHCLEESMKTCEALDSLNRTLQSFTRAEEVEASSF